MHRKHCSDEQLIAMLDGELGRRDQRHVEEHLAACWKCRARRAEIEDGIHRFSQEAERFPYPGPDWTIRARRRLLAGMAAREPDGAVTLRQMPAVSWGGRVRFPAMIAAGIALCFLVYSHWFQSSLRVEAHQRIDRFVESDRGLGSASLHQVMRVELRQTGHTERRKGLRVEVWSDPAANRHAMRWHDGGELIHAAWRSGTGDWGLSPGLTTDYPAAATLPDTLQAKWTPEDAEAELLAWMGSRVWKPLTFSEDLRQFASAPDAAVEAAPIGKNTVRLRATRKQPSVTTQWTVEMDEFTSRPNRQTIRWQRPDSEMEMEVVTEREETVASRSIPPGVFENPLPVEISELPPLPPPAADPAPDLPTKEDLTAAAIRAEYLLRHLPPDWVSALEVVEEEDAVVVRGVTETAAIREAVEEEIYGMDWVRADLRSVEEAPPLASAAEMLPAETPAREPEFPLEKELAAYFAETSPDREEAARRLAAFARDAAQLAARVRTESWLLWHLHERFPEERLETAPLHAHAQLETMRNQHRASLAEAAASLRALVWPVLHPLAAIPGEDAHQEAGSAGDTPAAEAVLPELSGDPADERISLEAAEAVDRRIRALLAGGSQIDPSARIAVQRLLDALETLQPERPSEAHAAAGLSDDDADDGALPQ